ncbi:MAG: hypothetical protein B0D92_07825 [Spirochaeta sp. LUC14_002_19_P3]|nr:MAG: hypothetical protein B0D92_07825 [Spirochaeta sp. LUC14_002_19_P3]
MNNKIRVGVLFGGRSCEHEVSVKSARAIVAAIDPDKYDITLVGISKTGHWLTSSDASKMLAADVVEGEELLPSSLEYSGSGQLAVGVGQTQAIDVIFPVLHGPYGEDGTVQGLLELSGLPYVGSGVAGSAVGMDKEMMRRVFRAENLPQVDYITVRRSKWKEREATVRADIESRFAYPFFIKPVNMGSSVGVSKVHDGKELSIAMEKAASYDTKIMVEAAALDCREVEAAVLGNVPLEAADALGEIVPGHEFYDYEAKYSDNTTELIIPARVSPETAARVQDIAVRACEAVGAYGLARVDFFVGKENEEIYLNEINTMPGFTPVSMYPQLWKASGLSYSRLIDRLIQLALEHHRDKMDICTVL